jgi:hypothetical protein
MPPSAASFAAAIEHVRIQYMIKTEKKFHAVGGAAITSVVAWLMRLMIVADVAATAVRRREFDRWT